MDFRVFSSSNSKRYFDHNATSPLSARVAEQVPYFLAEWGNPSSIHFASRGPKTIIRETRQNLATALGVSPLEFIFTSGGSESNNTVLQGVWHELKLTQSEKTEWITTEVEHPSIMKTMKTLEQWGATVHYLKVNRAGQIDLEQYQKLLSKKTALVSVMFANNETGVLFPIQKMADMAHEVGALFHSDCVQAFGKVELNLKDLHVDFASFSAHKFYSLKGTGFLYAKKGTSFESLIQGGGQERHRRGGTENTLGIASLGVMVGELKNVKVQSERINNLRDHFEKRVLAEISDVTITSFEAARLPNTSSLVLKACDGETMLMSLDIQGYAVSTGAACSSGSPEPSPVLLSIGLSRAEAQNSLRVSFGWENTISEVDEFIEVLKKVVTRLRNIENEGSVNNELSK